MKRLLRPLKPLFAVQVEQVVKPTYAQTHAVDAAVAAVDAAVAEVRSALGDHVDATAEAVAILGQRINQLEQRLAALEDAQETSAPLDTSAPTTSPPATG